MWCVVGKSLPADRRRIEKAQKLAADAKLVAEQAVQKAKEVKTNSDTEQKNDEDRSHRYLEKIEQDRIEHDKHAQEELKREVILCRCMSTLCVLMLLLFQLTRRFSACSRPKRPPFKSAGKFQWPPVPAFHYAPGTNFVDQWKFDSRATVVGDFNGDGRTDFARLGATKMYLFISRGDGTYWQPIYEFNSKLRFSHDENVWTTIGALDLNGDKKADILRTVIAFSHVFARLFRKKRLFVLTERRRERWIPVSGTERSLLVPEWQDSQVLFQGDELPLSWHHALPRRADMER